MRDGSAFLDDSHFRTIDTVLAVFYKNSIELHSFELSSIELHYIV